MYTTLGSCDHSVYNDISSDGWMVGWLVGCIIIMKLRTVIMGFRILFVQVRSFVCCFYFTVFFTYTCTE